VDRERKTPSTQVPRGAKQIVIPMTQQQYDDIWLCWFSVNGTDRLAL